MDFIKDILDFQTHGGATVYFVIGAASTLLFVLRLAGSVFLGADTDSDMDLHVDADGIESSTGSFNLISVFSVTSFLMGLGWMGVACRYDWQLSQGVTLAASLAMGLALMFLAAGLMYGIQRLKHEPQADLTTAIGHSGKVYMTIPGQGEGRGKVEVVASGQPKTFDAMTRGEGLAAFTAVTVVELDDNKTMVVEAKN